MRKYQLYLVVAVVFMTIPIFVKMFHNRHEVDYNVGKYEVHEVFSIRNREHYYDFIIKNGKRVFSYTLNEDVHKKKKVIRDIKLYKSNDLVCILPIYKISIRPLDLYCLKGEEQVSNTLLENNSDYLDILKQVKKYSIFKVSSSSKKINQDNIFVYQENIPTDMAIALWNYKGVFIIKNKGIEYQKFFDEDLYDNIMATVTSRYYVLFENTSVNGIFRIHYYDFVKGKYKVMKLEDGISKNSYINGVFQDLIYVSDVRLKKQYTINVGKEEIKEVGNEEVGFIQYVNGVKKSISKKEFFKDHYYFDNVRIMDPKISDSEDMILDGRYYYFRIDNSFYRQMVGGNRIHLFDLEADEWFVVHDKFLLRCEDTLYLYSDKLGLRTLIEYNELKYNYLNIYKLWE